MNALLRSTLYVVALLQIAAGIAFALQLSFVTDLWPLRYTQGLSYTFVGSIIAASGAGTLWCLWSREHGALTGVGLDYMFIATPLSIFAFQIAGSNTQLTTFAILALVTAAFGLVIVLNVRRIPVAPDPRLPAPVRVAFIIFVVTLLLVGGSMVLKTPNIVPWSVDSSGSVVYGWMYLGAAAYFSYSLLRPSWGNAGGQLSAFLAYDLILIVPMLARLPNIEERYTLNLWAYLVVVIGSGILAIYYLFIHPPTRIGAFRRGET
jgi:hypothetical protein